MRTLVDLNNRVAIITWYEKAVFKNNEKYEYESLYRKKHQWKDKLTDEEETILTALRDKKGIVDIGITSVAISELGPISTTEASPTMTLTGYEWMQISNAITNIRDELKSKEITVDESFNSDFEQYN